MLVPASCWSVVLRRFYVRSRFPAGRPERAGECCPAVAGISVEQPHLLELFFDVSGFDVHDRSCEVFPQHQTMGPGVSPQLRKQCLDKGSALIGESYEPESLFPCQAASRILSPGGEVLNGTQRIKLRGTPVAALHRLPLSSCSYISSK